MSLCSFAKTVLFPVSCFVFLCHEFTNVFLPCLLLLFLLSFRTSNIYSLTLNKQIASFRFSSFAKTTLVPCFLLRFSLPQIHECFSTLPIASVSSIILHFYNLLSNFKQTDCFISFLFILKDSLVSRFLLRFSLPRIHECFSTLPIASVSSIISYF